MKYSWVKVTAEVVLQDRTQTNDWCEGVIEGAVDVGDVVGFDVVDGYAVAAETNGDREDR